MTNDEELIAQEIVSARATLAEIKGESHENLPTL